MRGPSWLFVLILLVLAATHERAKLEAAFNFVNSKILKQPSTAVLIAVLVGWVLGFIVGRYRRRSRAHAFQNRGEALLSRAMTKTFRAPDYHLMNHVTLRLEDGTTQVDHVLVSRFGVFVIETKDYKGWIFGNPSDRYWTQVLYKFRFRFQNPVRQNYKHVCAIRELLEFLPSNAIRSAVVFAGQAKFKTDIPDGVFYLQGLLNHIAEQVTEVMSLNRVQFCVGRLETARLSIARTTDVEHVERLRRRYGSDE